MTTLARPPAGLRLPAAGVLTTPYREGCQAGELRYLRCRRCDTAAAAPAPVCPQCWSDDLRWERSAGRGTVYSWTVVWRPPGAAFGVPFAPVIVDMAEGWQLLSTLVDCEPEQAQIGLEVDVVFVPVANGELPCFRPVSDRGRATAS